MASSQFFKPPKEKSAYIVIQFPKDKHTPEEIRLSNFLMNNLKGNNLKVLLTGKVQNENDKNLINDFFARILDVLNKNEKFYSVLDHLMLAENMNQTPGTFLNPIIKVSERLLSTFNLEKNGMINPKDIRIEDILTVTHFWFQPKAAHQLKQAEEQAKVRSEQLQEAGTSGKALDTALNQAYALGEINKILKEAETINFSLPNPKANTSLKATISAAATENSTTTTNTAAAAPPTMAKK